MSIGNPSIAPDELAAAIGLPHCPILLDTRRQSAFDAADRVIAGAAWRDHRAVDQWGPLIPSDRDVVVYCVHGHQVSRSAVARLRERGLNARVLTGGIEAFIDAGGITIRKMDDLTDVMWRAEPLGHAGESQGRPIGVSLVDPPVC